MTARCPSCPADGLWAEGRCRTLCGVCPALTPPSATAESAPVARPAVPVRPATAAEEADDTDDDDTDDDDTDDDDANEATAWVEARRGAPAVGEEV